MRGGVDGDTAAFANVLANLGVVAPHTGEPLTEAMVLGVGGGLGAGYILWEFDALPFRARVLTLGFRRQWQYPDRWARGTAERLGLHAELHETGGAKARRGGARRPARHAACRRSPGSTPTRSGTAASRSGATATAARR